MVCDTNILIAYLSGDQKVIKAINGWWQQGQHLIVSSIITAELLSYAKLNDLEILAIKEFLSEFTRLSFTDSVAEVAASIRRQYDLELPDAAIAATALINSVALVSRDQQFKKVQELKIIEI